VHVYVPPTFQLRFPLKPPGHMQLKRQIADTCLYARKKHLVHGCCYNPPNPCDSRKDRTPLPLANVYVQCYVTIHDMIDCVHTMIRMNPA